MVFVFDRRRVRPSGLAGELVVAIESDTPVEATELDQQFARTPYAVSFETGSRGFTLVTLHVLYGEGARGSSRRTQRDRHLTATGLTTPDTRFRARSSTSRRRRTSTTRSPGSRRTAPAPYSLDFLSA
jgi:hypothetical protein